jgi:Na+/glutamate symporter
MSAASFAHQRSSDREKAERAIHVRETIGLVLAFLVCVTVAAIISTWSRPITNETAATDWPAAPL